jgi:hypothetical protein
LSSVTGAVCLLLVLALASVGTWLLFRGYRRDDALGSLLGLLVIVAAGIPAAAFGAVSS